MRRFLKWLCGGLSWRAAGKLDALGLPTDRYDAPFLGLDWSHFHDRAYEFPPIAELEDRWLSRQALAEKHHAWVDEILRPLPVLPPRGEANVRAGAGLAAG